MPILMRGGVGANILAGAIATMWSLQPSGATLAQNQFGGRDRADAVARMIVLGVQQGIGSLPPTSGQSFTFEYDPGSGEYKPNPRLGPTALRAVETVGQHNVSVRMATSYFELSDSLAAIPYSVSDESGTPLGVAKLGLDTQAKVGLVNIATSYGVTNRLELTLNLPVVVVDARASQVFSTRTNALGQPPQTAPLSGVPVVNGNVRAAVQRLNEQLQPGCELTLRKESFSDLGFRFNDGTHVGVGRISIGAKTVLPIELVELAFAPEFFFPSPSENEFAGAGTAAILPRVIVAYSAAEVLKLRMDVGYDLDFETDELRRLVWDAGISVPFERVSFDVGLGGSKFNQGIEWTPSSAPFVDTTGHHGTIAALGDNRLGDNFIDFLGGFKFELSKGVLLAGAISVPVNNEGFRAAALGTLAIELYL